MIEPRFRPPPMPVDPGMIRTLPDRRPTLRERLVPLAQSMIVLALGLGFVLLAGLGAQGVLAIVEAMRR